MARGGCSLPWRLIPLCFPVAQVNPQRVSQVGMDFPIAYIPRDRHMALTQNKELPQRMTGAALIADISGFTPLTESLALAYGPERGAEELTRQLDLVYDALVGWVELYRGAIIGFSGDAITCWFDDDNGSRATTAALGMQQDMAHFASISLPNGQNASLALKVSVATGTVLRFVVGDPNIQLIDIIAGSPIDRMADGEHHAMKGEVILDESTWVSLRDRVTIQAIRSDAESSAKFAVVSDLNLPEPPDPWPTLDDNALTEEQIRPWILQPVYDRLRAQESFLAELRPVVPLFLRFGTIDYENDPNAIEKLNKYICWVQRVVLKYDGSLIQLTIGDKGSYLYAVFGAPIAHQNDIIRAVAAAQELRESPPELHFIHSTQIGISRGRMRAGPYGSSLRRTYGTLGDEVNVAARLMQAATPGHILVTRAVAEGADPSFHFTELEPLRVKGKATLIPAFALDSEAHRVIHLQEPAYDLPIVGRAEELAIIQTKLELAAEGNGQIVGIAAEAGMGKSRLVAEALKQASMQGYVGYGGTCQSFGTNSSYMVWREIWESFFGLDPQAQIEDQIEQLKVELTRCNATLVQRLPLLSSVLGISIPDNDLTRSLDSQLRKESLETLLIDCIQARLDQNYEPIVFILEDCHWIDPLSDDLLAAIGRSCQNWRVLVLLTYRPLEPTAEQILSAMRLGNATVVPLSDFTASEAQRLIELKLSHFGQGSSTFGPEFVEQITARTGGNPFYIEEILNFLRDQSGGAQVLHALDTVGLPDSLHSLILSRIDRLSESQKITIKVASIIGRTFVFKWLWGAYPNLGGTHEVREDLLRLSSLDLTPLDVPEPELRYLFKHALTQQVAYESQPFAARTQMHGNMGGFLERTYSENLDKYINLLAYHYGHSANIAKRRDYYRRAGIAAEAAYDPESAINYYRHALADWSTPTDPGETALRFDVYEGLGRMLVNRANYADAGRTFHTLLELAHEANQPIVESRAWYGLASAQSSEGDQRAALESAKQAEDLAQQAGATRELLAALEIKGRCVFRLGDANAALKLGERVLQLAKEQAARPQMSRTLNLIGAANHVLGQYDEAQKAWEDAFEVAHTMNDRRQMMSLLNNLGVIADYRGDQHTALARYHEALKTAREIGHRDGEIVFLGNVGEAHVRLGEFELAEQDLREKIKMEEAGGSRNRAVTFALLAEAVLGQGRVEEALEAARTALEIQQRAGDQALLAATWRVLGQVATHFDQPLSILEAEGKDTKLFTAADCFEESIRICQEYSMEGERARTLREWAISDIQSGAYDQGVLRWATARELFKELGADFEVAGMQELPGPNLSVIFARNGVPE